MNNKILTVMLLVSLTGCASQSGLNNDSKDATESWTNYRGNKSAQQLSEKQSTLVFYRKDDDNPNNFNVYVNGSYHASIEPNSQSSVVVCSGNLHLHTAVVNSKTFNNHKETFDVVANTKDGVYIRVIPTARYKATLQTVKKEIAEQATTNLPTVNHTLSRVVIKKCLTGNKKSLKTSVLFDFDKHHKQSILLDGSQQLYAFVAKVKKTKGIKKIIINAYTDPLGSEQYNLRLSKQRANTVKRLLTEAGIKSLIFANGLGETRQFVSNCQGSRAQIKACYLKNRRAEIITLL